MVAYLERWVPKPLLTVYEKKPPKGFNYRREVGPLLTGGNSKGDILRMPVVFRYKGYRFFFFSNEGDPLEPMHIHVRRGEATAKLWVVADQPCGIVRDDLC